MPVKSTTSMKLSSNNRDIILPFRLHFLDISKVPIPLVELGAKLLLNDIVCPLLIEVVYAPPFNVTQLPPSIQYLQSLVSNLAVKPSSRASIVK